MLQEPMGVILRILIIGGCGFVGSNISNHFLQNGDDLIVYDNLSRKGVEKNLKWLRQISKNKIKFIDGDIRNFELLKNSIDNVDVIFHTAAQVAVTTAINNPAEDFQINALGTFNILEATRQSKNDPVVIYTSTNKVYGNNVNSIPLIEKKTRYEFGDKKFKNGIPETFPVDADEHTPYGCSKYAADLYVRDYSAVYDMKTVAFRMSCIYGFRQFGTEDQGWLAHFIISSIMGRPIKIYGDGKQVRDILFIDDLVHAFETVVSKINKTKGKAYNIGGGTNNSISLLELISILEKLNSKIDFSFDDWRPFDQKVYISDIRKAERDFNWYPKTTKESGIRKLFTWVNSNKSLFT